MRKSRTARILFLSLAFILLGNILTACAAGAKTSQGSTGPAASTNGQSTQSTTTASQKQQTPLLVAYDPFSENFSQFYAGSAPDADVVSMTGVRLLTMDRAGGIIYKAIAGETVEYAGTAYFYQGIADLAIDYDATAGQTRYTWKIRDDIRFSNGELLTADDIIFTYYVYCDPDYDGPGALGSVPILGLQDYRTQTTAEVYTRYAALFSRIYAAGAEHEWQEEDGWSKSQQDSVWELLETGWRTHVQKIIDFAASELLDLAEQLTGYSAAQIQADEGTQAMVGMLLWGVADFSEDGMLVGRSSGKKWDLPAGVYPSAADFYAESYLVYEGNPEAYFYESVLDDETPLLEAAQAEFVTLWGGRDEAMGGQGIANISGIEKVSDTVVQVTVDGYDAAAVYLLGINVAPLYHYGDPARYDYANNRFGFDFGDLSGVRAKNAEPAGAGPYKFLKYANKTVYFATNEYYYKGEPLISNVQFKGTGSGANIAGVAAGSIDVAAPDFNKSTVAEIKKHNPNGELTGGKIETRTTNDLSYRYIGINAKKVNVAGEPASEASKNLRRGLATILAAYRDPASDSFYGELASVINYPISASSWAAPSPADKGYKIAFSTALDGSSLYEAKMSPEQKQAAASKAALEYFVAAGYSLDETKTRLAAAPEGASLEYEIIIPGNGEGDHPAFLLATEAREAFAQIGISLVINDPLDINFLWDSLDAGTQELWSAGWKADLEPELDQIYHSSNVVGQTGSSAANSYYIKDDELDDLLMQASSSTDQAFRKAAYRLCLDIILDWAVEIPFTQQKNAVVFSGTRVDLDTVAADLTPYWGWLAEIEQLRLK